MRDIAIDFTDLSARTINRLKRAEIFNVSQLMTITEEELLSLKQMGAKGIQEVLDFQKRYAENPHDFYHKLDSMEIIERSCAKKNKECLVIEILFPQVNNRNRKTVAVLFKNKDDLFVENIDISDIEYFSVRTQNGLRNAGIFTIRDVVMLENGILRDTRNLGEKSLSEIYEFLKNNTKLVYEGDEVHDDVDNIFTSASKEITKDKPEHDFEFLFQELKKSIWNNIDDLTGIASNPEEIVMSEAFKDIIGRAVEVREAFANHFYRIINNNPIFIDANKLKEWIPNVLAYEDLFSDVMNDLVAKNTIEEYKTGYRKKLPNIHDWIDSLKGKARTIVQMRLKNATLEECGQLLGITRERVRQIFSHAVRNKPVLREDDFSYWYQTYDLDKEAMEYIFGVTPDIYAYYKAVYGSGGKKDVYDIVEDSNTTAEVYAGFRKYEIRNSILIGDEYVPVTRELLCRKFAQFKCSNDEISFDEFYSEYLQLLESYGLRDNQKLLFPTERAFEARLQDSMYILYKYRRKMRYYPIHEYDIEEMVSSLHLEQFCDIEISTRKLLVEYPEVMQEYDIRDEYELHNLLNKTKDIWNNAGNYDVQMTRMPFMVFGNADRAKQTERLLYQIAPVTKEEFGKYYEEEFGARANTALANMGKLVSKYYHNGVYSVDQPRLTYAEKMFLESQMTNDFYFVEDVESLFINRFGRYGIEHLNPRSYKELGYKVFSNYLIKNKYNSAEQYFTYLFTRKPLLDMNDLDTRLIYVQSANQALNVLKNNYDILEYEDKKYISFNRFSSVVNEIDKEKLKRYVDQAICTSGEEEFFTIKSLKLKGFKSELHDVGFGDWFNAGLLKNSKRIRYIRTASGTIFSKSNKQKTLLDFFEYLLKKYRKIDIYEFVDMIFGDYGIVIKKEKITWIIKDSDLYYDSIMEKIYLNKELYYEEL